MKVECQLELSVFQSDNEMHPKYVLPFYPIPELSSSIIISLTERQSKTVELHSVTNFNSCLRDPVYLVNIAKILILKK